MSIWKCQLPLYKGKEIVYSLLNIGKPRVLRFDSDQMIITNNEILIKACKKNYKIFTVPTSNVHASKTVRYYTKEHMADLDNKTGKNKIGEIVNLSQQLNSLLWEKFNAIERANEKAARLGGEIQDPYEAVKEIYYDVCQLDVMSCIEIDKAKKEFTVDNGKELNKMREKYSDVLCSVDDEDNQKKHRKPAFFGYVAKTKGYFDAKHNLYVPHDTSMDYLYKILVKFRTPKVSKKDTKFSDLFMFDGYNPRAVNYRQINDIIAAVQETQESIDSLFADKTLCAWYDRKDVIQSAKDCLYEKINVMHLNESTMLHLIRYLDNKKYSKINRLLFVTLFNYKHKTITNMLKSKEPVRTELVQDISGDIDLYGIKFSKVELPEVE